MGGDGRGTAPIHLLEPERALSHLVRVLAVSSPLRCLILSLVSDGWQNLVYVQVVWLGSGWRWVCKVRAPPQLPVPF